jgi:hypothetical protein
MGHIGSNRSDHQFRNAVGNRTGPARVIMS